MLFIPISQVVRAMGTPGPSIGGSPGFPFTPVPRWQDTSLTPPPTAGSLLATPSGALEMLREAERKQRRAVEESAARLRQTPEDVNSRSREETIRAQADEISRLRSQLATKDLELQHLRDNLSQQTDKNTVTMRRLTRLQDEVSQAREAVADLQSQLSAEQLDKARLQSLLHEAQQKLQEQAAEDAEKIRRLREELDTTVREMKRSASLL